MTRRGDRGQCCLILLMGDCLVYNCKLDFSLAIIVKEFCQKFLIVLKKAEFTDVPKG